MSRIQGWTKASSLALRFVLFAGVVVCAQLAGPAWAGVIYVRGDAAGAKTGLSWANAYTDLQAGLAAAEWGDEIWVAQGTYKPTTGTLRTVSFALEAGVGLYGGFAGAETEREQRNWEANATILSGDIGTTGSAADNTLCVVVGADRAVLDGFTITGGNNLSSGHGGGMYNLNCSLTVTNCTFSGNAAYNGGGGMYNKDCSLTVTNCTFSGNTGSEAYSSGGGGMTNDGGSPIITNCTFSGNTTSGLGGRGGGMYNTNNSSATVTNCGFSGNSAENGGGGGMHNYQSSPTITNCTFSGNTADGGGGMFSDGSSPTVTNCTFSGNTANSGGGMFNNSSSPTLTGCMFSGNTAGGGGGMFNYHSSSPDVTNCTFTGNTAYGGQGVYNGGGGMFNEGGSPNVTNCTFSGNAAVNNGGGMFNDGSSPTVANCTFSGNTTDNGHGGGMHSESYCSPIVTNCTFSGNTADNGYGGGIASGDWSSPTVANCTFNGNTAVRGGGMLNYGSSGSSLTVTNCIFWDNSAPSGAEIYNDSGTPTFSHCDITGCGGSGVSWDAALGVDGGGNIAADPRFLAPATPAGTDGLWRTSDDGLRLQSDSPCIGAADPAAAPPKDILGLPRSSPPDIGAYEFPSGGYCTLTYNAGAGGSISGITPQTVDYGTSGTAVEAVPSIGYHFVQWSDASTANPRTDTNVTTDVTVTATFAINTYTLTYNAGAGGSIIGTTPQTVDYGTSGTAVEAVPATGYRFVRWSDDVMTASRTDTNVTADITVTAIFAHSNPAAVKDWALYE